MLSANLHGATGLSRAPIFNESSRKAQPISPRIQFIVGILKDYILRLTFNDLSGNTNIQDLKPLLDESIELPGRLSNIAEQVSRPLWEKIEQNGDNQQKVHLGSINVGGCKLQLYGQQGYCQDCQERKRETYLITIQNTPEDYAELPSDDLKKQGMPIEYCVYRDTLSEEQHHPALVNQIAPITPEEQILIDGKLLDQLIIIQAQCKKWEEHYPNNPHIGAVTNKILGTILGDNESLRYLDTSPSSRHFYYTEQEQFLTALQNKFAELKSDIESKEQTAHNMGVSHATVLNKKPCIEADHAIEQTQNTERNTRFRGYISAIRLQCNEFMARDSEAIRPYTQLLHKLLQKTIHNKPIEEWKPRTLSQDHKAFSPFEQEIIIYIIRIINGLRLLATSEAEGNKKDPFKDFKSDILEKSSPGTLLEHDSLKIWASNCPTTGAIDITHQDDINIATQLSLA